MEASERKKLEKKIKPRFKCLWDIYGEEKYSLFSGIIIIELYHTRRSRKKRKWRIGRIKKNWIDEATKQFKRDRNRPRDFFSNAGNKKIMKISQKGAENNEKGE